MPVEHSGAGGRPPDAARLSDRLLPLAGLAGVREAVYRSISEALLYPSDDRIAALRNAKNGLAAQSDTAAQFAFYEDWRSLLSTLGTLDGARTGELQGQYIRLFQAAPGGVPCPPYESFYVDDGRLPTGWVLALVEGEFLLAGVAISPEVHEQPDHIAMELEFLAILCGQESAAWEDGDPVQARKALHTERRFLSRHLCSWLPSFAERVSVADTTGFYNAISAAGDAFVRYDADLVSALYELALEVASADADIDEIS